MQKTLVNKDISLDLNLTSLDMKFSAPVPDSVIIEWARGKYRVEPLLQRKRERKTQTIKERGLIRIQIGYKKT